MSPGSRLRPALAALAAVGLAVGTAACGSSGHSATGSSNTSGGTSKAAASGTPLYVGVLDNITGALPSGEQDAPPVLKAWAKSVNASGGVAGHPVVFQFYDTQGLPANGIAAAEQAASNKKLVAVVMFDAEGESSYASIIEKSGLPVIGGMGFNTNAWAKYPNWLPLNTSEPAVLNMGMVLGKSLGGHVAALSICSEVSACASVGAIAQRAAEAVGMKYAATVLISSSAPNYTAPCLELKDKGVDYVMDGAATVQGVMRFAGDCKQQGYTGQWGAFGASIDPQVMIADQPPGGITMGVALNSFPWFAPNPPVVAYRTMMASEGVPESAWANPHSTAAYATMQLFKKTLDGYRAQLPTDPTASDIISAYGTIKNETLGGLLAQPITFTPNQPEPMVTCYWFGKFVNGTFTDADLNKTSCDPLSLQNG